MDTCSVGDYLLYAMLGWLLMWLWNKQPLSVWLGKKNAILKELFACPLCLGVWFYWALALILRINVFTRVYVPLLSEFFTGAVTSFIAYLVWMGWNQRFGIFLVSGKEE